jgi:hypothetical protein
MEKALGVFASWRFKIFLFWYQRVENSWMRRKARGDETPFKLLSVMAGLDPAISSRLTD